METAAKKEYFSIDLRQYPRLRIPAPFACSLSRLGLTRWFSRDRESIGVVFDVSMKGAKVMSETGIRLGDRIAVSLRLPNQVTPMTVEEAAVRWEKDQTYGLEFINLSPVAEMRLRKFITIASMPVR